MKTTIKKFIETVNEMAEIASDLDEPRIAIHGIILVQSEIEKTLKPLLDGVDNRCDELGHNMYSVYSLNNFHNNGKSAFGLNKCSRCGHQDEWQYDF